MSSIFKKSFIQLLLAVVLVAGLGGCTTKQASKESSTVKFASVSNDQPWSERMAQSVIARAPIAWMNDFQEKPKWTYTIGLVMNSMCKVGEVTGKKEYFDYARGYGDTMILADGSIRGYDIGKFNIDNIAPGPYLFSVYNVTKEKRYETAINTLKRQLEWQPQTTDGGYWHKLIYPWQIWLDGLYMGEPFQAEYAMRYNQPELFDHIAKQFMLVEKHLRDSETGLLYHAWDESRVQRWSNSETGTSPHFWSRAIGWYCMGLVDVLDFFPAKHPNRAELIAILNRTLEAVLKVQDPTTHTWWQVIDMPNKAGNYLEATGSCMFTYAMIKGVNKGYLDQRYQKIARESFDGILETFIRVDENGLVNLTNCCSVAGLGGNPYRDGSYEYYINEPVRENDAKGIGPFILASLEFENARKRNS